MNKKLIFAVLASCSLVFATEDPEQIENRVEDINARKGLEISGTVRSASFNSYFDSPDERPNSVVCPPGTPPANCYQGSYMNRMPNHEISEFVQVDLNFKFRPWDIITANLLLRLGAGAQEYFAAASTTVSVPWMNIEGNVGESFYWVVGDFRQSYSPLTLYMPGIDIMYEPTIFARKREMAQKEALLQDNQRNLQGFNLQFRPQLGEPFGELRVEALMARLRRAGYLDASGAMGNMLPNEGIPGATQAGRFDKFLIGTNIELLPLDKNLLIGGTYLSIFDDKGTSKSYSCPSCPLNAYDKEFLLNTLDSLPQKTSIIAIRAGADVAGLLGNSSLVANLTAELAMSKDDAYDLISVPDPSDASKTITESISRQEDGKAILMQMDLGYKGDINAVLSTSFIRNDSGWFNNVAQSPSFFARRVLNSDKDVGCRVNGHCTNTDFNLSKYGVYSPLYSSFDALYFFTPKHSPMHPSLTPGEPSSNDQTRSYNASPYAKTSWNPSVLTRAELALLEELSDLNLQMALPNGFATSNRQGYQEVLTVSWNELIEVKGLFANYGQLNAVARTKSAQYSEFGGGAKVSAFGVELSGSYKQSAKEQEFQDFGKVEFNSDFTNVGFYWRFYKRFGFAFGYQKINSDLNAEGANVQRAQTSNLKGGPPTIPVTTFAIMPVVKSAQNQWMAGIDYTIAPHAWLSVNYGVMSVENTYDLNGFVNDNGEISLGTNLPNYLVVNGTEAGKKELRHEFSRNILEATINVEF